MRQECSHNQLLPIQTTDCCVRCEARVNESTDTSQQGRQNRVRNEKQGPRITQALYMQSASISHYDLKLFKPVRKSCEHIQS